MFYDVGLYKIKHFRALPHQPPISRPAKPKRLVSITEKANFNNQIKPLNKFSVVLRVLYRPFLRTFRNVLDTLALKNARKIFSNE